MLTAFLVNSLADVVAADSVVTLREALEAANTNTAVYDAEAGSAMESDVITFDPDLFTDGGNPRPGVITLGGSQLEVTDPAGVDIHGPGAGELAVNALGRSRVFYIGSGAEASLGNLTITGGSTTSGGGIYNRGWLTITDCTVSSNTASNSGGGICNDGDDGTAALRVTGSLLSGNTASASGGGIYNCGGSGVVSHGVAVLSVTHSALSGNSAGDDGGGIYSCYYHSGWQPGYNYNGTPLMLADCVLSGNSAGGNGGGIYNYREWPSDDIYYGSTAPTVTNCTISDNTADSGGGVYHDHGELMVTNSMISCNSASDNGGAIYNCDTLTVTNSTICRNSAHYGGGICTAGSVSTSTLSNTVVAGNGAWTGVDIESSGGTLSGSHNLIGNGADQSALVDGVDGNQVGTSSSPIDPLLSNWTQFDSGQWGYCLLPGSPAIDAGANGLALDPMGKPLTEDMAGNPRIVGGTVDIGAVEGATTVTPAQTYVVTSLADVIDPGDGELTFVEAFEAAQRNQPVGNALAGSFSQQDIIQFVDGLSGTILLDEGELTVVGDLSIDGPGAELLTFDAKGQNRVFLIRPSVSVGLSGMTITGGSAREGGGIYNLGTLTVTNSTISGNLAESGGGGGVYSGGTLTVTNATISDNSAESGCGGGICTSGKMTITGSTISNNWAINGNGGGVYNSGSLVVSTSTISGNSVSTRDWQGPVDLSGGGTYNSGIMSVRNSTISQNSSVYGGGISNSGTAVAANSVIVLNYAKNAGAIDNDGTLTVTSSTVTGNMSFDVFHSSEGWCIYSTNTMTITNSIVACNDTPVSWGLSVPTHVYGPLSPESGSNLFDDDPRFVCGPSLYGDGAIDLRLRSDSPAINAGSNALAVDPDGNPLTTDLDGNPRIVGSTIDLGAYEFQSVVCCCLTARIVAEPTATDANGEMNVLPDNAEWIDEWDTSWIEIWVSRPNGSDVGIVSAQVDLIYSTDSFTATAIEYGPAFTENQTGTIDDAAGVVHDLGAGTLRTDVGDDQYVLLARVKFDSCLSSETHGDAAGLPIAVDVYPAASGCGITLSNAQVTLVGGAAADVTLGDVPETELWPVMYDLDDDGQVGLGDLSYFAAAYHHMTDDFSVAYIQASDFDHDGQVGLGDLSYFAAAYHRMHTDLEPMLYPAVFPNAWRQTTEAAELADPPAALPDCSSVSQPIVGPVLRTCLEMDATAGLSSSAAPVLRGEHCWTSQQRHPGQSYTSIPEHVLRDRIAAHDATLIQEYGCRRLDQASIQYQRLAWSHAQARRQSHERLSRILNKTALAIDLVLADR